MTALRRRSVVNGIGAAIILPAALCSRIGLANPVSSGLTEDAALPRYRLADLVTLEGLSDHTAALQQAVAWAIAAGPCALSLGGATLNIGVIDLSGAKNLIIDGEGARLIPISQVGGRFVGREFGRIAITRCEFAQRSGWNYMPAIELARGQAVTLHQIRMLGCGFGASVRTVDAVEFDKIRLREIGIYPRPHPLDPSPAGFSNGFEVYGGGLRASFCGQVVFGDGIDFANHQPAGGHVSDKTGGAGGCTTFACNNVFFGAGSVFNAPGQGFCAAGEWQGQDVVGQILSGTFQEDRRGRGVTFKGSRASGCNQEGCTAFGVTDVAFHDVRSFNNRNADIEVWNCVRAHISGGVIWEDPAQSHPLRNFGQLGGVAAVHIVDSSDVTVEKLHCVRSRRAGVDIGGSRRVILRQCEIFQYGQDDDVGYLASGIVNTAGARGRVADDVAIGPENVFSRAPIKYNRGGDLFAQNSSQHIFAWGNKAHGRTVSLVNAPAAFRDFPPTSFRVKVPHLPLT